MHHINVKRFGSATAATIVLLYILCIIGTSFLSTASMVAVLNTLMHSIDASTIVRTTPTPFSELATGVVVWAIGSWLIGACIAALYNAFNRPGNSLRPETK